jgi:hypothetical protein
VYVQQRPVGQLPPAPPVEKRSVVRDVLVTTLALVVGTVVVEKLRKRKII